MEGEEGKLLHNIGAGVTSCLNQVAEKPNHFCIKQSDGTVKSATVHIIVTL